MSVPRAAVGLIVVAVLLAATGGSAVNGDGDDHRPPRQVRAAMDAAVADAGVEDGGVPGILGGAADGDRTWHGAAGVADRRTGAPRRPEERFRIGSVTKTFVATVLLQLAAEGRLSLDQPVERWLPGMVRGRGHDGRRITVRQLLGHTSGVFDYTQDPAFRRMALGQDFAARRYEIRGPAGLVRTAMAHPPRFAPGTGWAYSNTNYVLAGLIVEAVTGRGYAEEIERRIIGPLRLRDTSLPGSATAVPGPHARGYAEQRDVTALVPSLAGASGEMISSAADLNVFLRELLGGRLLPDRQLREMTAAVPVVAGGGADVARERYGLGLSARKLSCGTTVWGHDGTIQGSESLAFATRDGTHSAAFNANASGARNWHDAARALLEAEFCG